MMVIMMMAITCGLKPHSRHWFIVIIMKSHKVPNLHCYRLRSRNVVGLLIILLIHIISDIYLFRIVATTMVTSYIYIEKFRVLRNGVLLPACNVHGTKSFSAENLIVFLVKYVAFLEENSIYTHNSKNKSYLWTEWSLKPTNVLEWRPTWFHGVPHRFVPLNPSFIFVQLGTVRSISL